MRQSDLYKAVFGEEHKRETYSLVPHAMSENNRIIGKPYCGHCGLIALNNDFTRWSMKMGCLSHLHPNYLQQRAKTSVDKLK